MTALNLALGAILMLSALGAVTGRHEARKLYVDLERAQAHSRQLETEWGQLRLEQSTLAMHTRIEKIAVARLRMRVPDPSRVRMVPLPAEELKAQP
jgi:cell division protein FtsL